MTRRLVLSVCLSCTLPALASTGNPIEAGPQTPSIDSIGLSVGDETSFDVQGFRLFVGGFRCDGVGNTYTIPLVRGSEKSPATILRVSSKDAAASRISVSAALHLQDLDVAINSIAVDTRGRLHALLSVSAPSGGHQAIVAFDDEGRVAGKVDLDPEEIVAHRVAVFDSGEFLLVGQRRLTPEGRVVVMDSGGGPLRDVAAPIESAWRADEGSFAEAAPDGRVYLATSGGGTVYAITSAGRIGGAIRLAAPHAAASLIDLQVSAGRVAAIYHIREAQRTLRWITVHDLVSGERVGTYGPVADIVMCYRPDGPRDRFALLGSRAGRFVLMTASPR